MAHAKIMIIGSDGFSDLYGGRLAQAIHDLNPNITLFGVGGTIMQSSGVRLLYDISELENIGGFEALKASHVIRRLIQRISESIDKFQPKIVVQVGLPVFNLRLIEIAKSKNIPIFYYNTPLNWSSTEVKVTHLAKLVDKVIGVSRYETEICKQNNIDVEFVGHPLVDIVNAAKSIREEEHIVIAPDKPVVALLPGKNEVEVKAVLPTLIKAMKHLNTEIIPIQVIVSIPPTIRPDCYESIISKSGFNDVQITTDTHGVFHAADVAVVTCGSKSIEAALARVPAVAVHKVATATYFIDKMLSRKAYIAMVNFVLQETVMPELIQSDFNKMKVVEEVSRFLQDQQAKTEYAAVLERLPEEFGEQGAISRAAQVVLSRLVD